ncbi:hypothetical protein LOZ01_006897, partial [Ophidiomyces ophidiicola]
SPKQIPRPNPARADDPLLHPVRDGAARPARYRAVGVLRDPVQEQQQGHQGPRQGPPRLVHREAAPPPPAAAAVVCPLVLVAPTPTPTPTRAPAPAPACPLVLGFVLGFPVVVVIDGRIVGEQRHGRDGWHRDVGGGGGQSRRREAPHEHVPPSVVVSEHAKQRR